MISKRIKWGVLLCIILVSFYGCSSNSGGNTSSSGLSSSPYYKFYIDTNTSTIYAVDPNNPTSPKYVVDNVTISPYNIPNFVSDVIYSWQYNATSYKWFNVHESYIFYIKNGSIYKLPTNTTSFTPIQVSNLNTDICGAFPIGVNMNATRNFIRVETAGLDGVCYGYCATTSTNYSADNQYYLVRLDMSSSDSPISIPQNYYIVGSYVDFNTGKPGGLFVDNNGTYEVCDENLDNCISMNATDLCLLGDYPTKAYFSINGTEIYTFDKSSKRLASLIYTLPYNLVTSLQNGDTIYFTTNSTIYKLDTTSDTVTSLYTDTQPICDMGLTNDTIVYCTYTYPTSTYYSYTYYIKILDKTGGAPITVFSFNATLPAWPPVIVSSNKIVIPTNNATLIYDEYGNLLQTFNGPIIGMQFPNSGKLEYRDGPTKIFIADNVTSNLNLVSMADLSATTISVPTDIVAWDHSFGNNNIFLITGITNDKEGDIFFLDTSKNSFIRVTNTPDNEIATMSFPIFH